MNKLSVTIVSAIALAMTMPSLAQDMEDTITVTSSIFDHHGMVPEENSAYGANTSIDLNWSNLPAGTQSLALICDDPKVVEIGMMETPFVHWVVYNIPASAAGIPGGLSSEAEPSASGLAGMINGNNGLGRPGYFGPRPPANGQLHQYDFRIYALDADLDLDAGLGKDELLEAIDGHVLGTGLLMGHYERKE
ncbi:YbhB/YbcL family Raf kinase inhibitor-like protein [Gammaproteobacteria bacterium]|nr:YbhB/YbcL family Raf kinase inhibitor-like protein [Gammaproteobacteria bacterium]